MIYNYEIYLLILSKKTKHEDTHNCQHKWLIYRIVMLLTLLLGNQNLQTQTIVILV